MQIPGQLANLSPPETSRKARLAPDRPSRDPGQAPFQPARGAVETTRPAAQPRLGLSGELSGGVRLQAARVQIAINRAAHGAGDFRRTEEIQVHIAEFVQPRPHPQRVGLALLHGAELPDP